MRKCFVLRCIYVLCTLLLFSCHRSDRSQLVGVWVSDFKASTWFDEDGNEVLEPQGILVSVRSAFRADNTLTAWEISPVRTNVYQGRFTVQGNQIRVSPDGQNEHGTYTLDFDGDTMSMSNDKGIFVYRKQ